MNTKDQFANIRNPTTSTMPTMRELPPNGVSEEEQEVLLKNGTTIKPTKENSSHEPTEPKKEQITAPLATNAKQKNASTDDSTLTSSMLDLCSLRLVSRGVIVLFVFILLSIVLRIHSNDQFPSVREETTVVRHTILEHPQFVFLMGTEGCGHHLWSSLVKKSPNIKKLRRLELLDAARSISHQLFDIKNMKESLFAGSVCDAEWNGTKLLEQTAQKLRLVASKLPPDLTVPLNGIPTPGTGMMSYPNFGDRNEICSPFRSPDMSLLQKACNMAHVSCHFIVQYRDPLAQLRSTTLKREYHQVGYAIALYTATLNSLGLQVSQLPSAVEFCWDFSDSRPSARLGALLGYETEEQFRTFFANEFQAPTVSKTNNSDVVPKQYEMLMDSLMTAYRNLQKTCHDMEPMR
jgi:hypothetical protein